MTAICEDGHAGWRKFDIDCRDALPVSIAFTDNARMIVSGERNSDVPGGRLVQYHVSPDPGKRNTPQNLKSLDSIERAVVSKDGKWAAIITGTGVAVRNMSTHEVVEVALGAPVHDIDVSPDSTRFVTGSEDNTVRIFSITTGSLLFELSQHKNRVVGVKFSPNGDYLATAAFGESIRVWDAGKNYELLRASSEVIHGPAPDAAYTAAQSPTLIPLGWSSHSELIFTISSGNVVMFSRLPNMWPSTPYYQNRGPVSQAVQMQGSIPALSYATFCPLVTNGRIIACAVGRSLSFWDTFTRSKIGPIITLQDSIRSLALSADNSYLACGGGDKKITIYLLRDILPLHDIIDPTCHLPFLKLSYRVFQPWIGQDLAKANAVLAKESRGSPNVNHALMQAWSQSWSGAVEEAKKVLSAQPIGHIVLARALIGQGHSERAFETIDAIFRKCGADETLFLLLVKAILIFLSGKRENAVARVKDLISIADDSEKYNCHQVLGNMYLIQGDWKEAFESFGHANSLAFYRRGHHLMTILLIFGPSFEERELALRHPLREAITA